MRILNLWNKPHITAQTSIPEADGFGDAFLLSLSLFGFLCVTFVSFTDVLINRFKTLLIKRISKLHEDTQRGTLAELAAHFKQTPPKGEIVLIVAGKDGK